MSSFMFVCHSSVFWFFWFFWLFWFSAHVDALQVAAGNRRRNYSVVGVDDGDDVHPQQLVQRAVQVTAFLLVVEIQVCDQDLRTGARDVLKRVRERRTSLTLSEREGRT